MIKVLIVDDSVLFSNLLKTKLSECSDIEVVGTASDPYEARDKILSLEPDIMTLDIEMPKMDGMKFLKKLLPQYPLPVIMISSLSEKKAEAMHNGAISFYTKPSAGDAGAVNLFAKKIVRDMRLTYPEKAEQPRVVHTELPHTVIGNISSHNGIDIIALGASTGGTDALEAVVKGFNKECPPIIITQHMPPVFTKMYAERLDRCTSLSVSEAVDGMRLSKGMCVIAEGGKHLELCKDVKGYYVKSREGEKVSGHCPSVDVMFSSAAKAAGKAVAAALLTGMGADGAKGLLELRKAGAYTLGQNKETCVVYGMPMEAYKMGAVCEEVPLGEISGRILKKMNMN